MMPERPLTDSMQDALLRMAADEGSLVQHRGRDVYWTTPHTVRKWGGPVWFTKTGTVLALQRRGLARRDPGPGASRITLTEAGWVVARAAQAFDTPAPGADLPQGDDQDPSFAADDA